MLQVEPTATPPASVAFCARVYMCVCEFVNMSAINTGEFRIAPGSHVSPPICHQCRARVRGGLRTHLHVDHGEMSTQFFGEQEGGHAAPCQFIACCSRF